MHQFLPYAWFQGRCVPFEDAKVSVATHALHYGTGAFGGMRAGSTHDFVHQVPGRQPHLQFHCKPI